MPVRRALLLACCLVAHALVVTGEPAAAQTAPPPGSVEYRPPVDAPVVDPFRPPATPYGPGNRGVDLATREGEPVAASAPGEVVFAGPVAGTLHVVVLHADGLRTSYSFLRTVEVRTGARVDAGDRVGTAATVLHVGVRAGDAYLDPTALWGDGYEVRLVPLEEWPALDEARRALADRLLDRRDGPGRARRFVSAAVAWARRGAGAAADYVRAEVSSLAEELLTWAHYAVELRPTTHLLRLGGAAWRWWQRRDDCTPAGVDPPPPAGRRIAVLVAGLGSTSERAAVDDVDTARLGYEGGDVVRFSYAGGRVPGTGASLPGLAESRYDAAHSEGDLRDAGARLAALVAAIRRAAPGIPIDVIAHSQGGWWPGWPSPVPPTWPVARS
jgi:murein DD-endopeptidase MepM/ murein hydrolase activator NlpD